jgi:hypothetical protein
VAAGDLLVLPKQYEYNALLWGSGTNIIAEKITGLHSLPDINVNDLPRNARHGEFANTLLQAGREVGFDLHVLEDDAEAVEALMLDVQDAFDPEEVEDEIPFCFSRPGLPNRMIMARPIRRDFDSDFRSEYGRFSGSVLLKATDPTIYSLATHTEAATITGGNSSVSDVITNAGRRRSRWMDIYITGPSTNPRIQFVEDGSTIRLDIVVGVGETLHISVKDEYVDLDGTKRYDVIRNDNEFPTLRKGANNVVYNRTGTTGSSTMTIIYKDAWS